MRLPRDGRKYELVDGEIRVSPAGARHGAICVRLAAAIGSHVRQNRLGHVFDSSTGFRWPGRKPGPPNLAVEVLSPDDRRRDLLEKVGEYLDAGSRLVGVVDPETRTAAVYRSLTDVRHVDYRGHLEGGDVLPGLSFALADVLA